ncbi:S10 family serine carboxypeptidase-like protein [Kordiimonas pumila]|uniref:Peptidase S10 n=1 Tax=Kordiimonas pumila TaxID=2161677 RepID=A0ABV7D494_9PROT|nr:hypothetical protein [Kordiimonas pumila]
MAISRRMFLYSGSIAGSLLSALVSTSGGRASEECSKQEGKWESVTNKEDDRTRYEFARSFVKDGPRKCQREIEISGRRLSYEVSVGAIVIADSCGKELGIFVYTSYTKNGNISNDRPVTFAWTGGPSGPSTSFHFGSLGPKIRTDKTSNQLEDNAGSILDRTDLVMVDPIGTGWSVPAMGRDLGDFYSVSKDAVTVAEFIKGYLKETNRPAAPIYLIGRSYGSVRLASVIHYLQASRLNISGLIPVAAAMDGNAFWESSGNMASYYLMLPNYAVIAWYHKRQSNPRKTARETLEYASHFALGDYLSALMRWRELSRAERKPVLDKLYALTGIKQHVWEKHNLRISGRQFAVEFLREEKKVLRSSDAREAWLISDLKKKSPLTSPSFLDLEYVDLYYRDDLGIAGAPPYRPFAPGLGVAEQAPFTRSWEVDRRGVYSLGAFQVSVLPNFLDDIAEAMIANPSLRIQQHNGMYDLQSTSFPANWSLSNMNIPASLFKNVEMFDYESGHAIYSSPELLNTFLERVSSFYIEEG